MSKEILVSVLSDDLFSLNWMSLLLVRDWRTRVFTEGELFSPLQENDENMRYVNLVVADIDSFIHNTNLFNNLNRILSENQSILVVGVGSRIEPLFFPKSPNSQYWWVFAKIRNLIFFRLGSEYGSGRLSGLHSGHAPCGI